MACYRTKMSGHLDDLNTYGSSQGVRNTQVPLYMHSTCLWKITHSNIYVRSLLLYINYLFYISAFVFAFRKHTYIYFYNRKGHFINWASLVVAKKTTKAVKLKISCNIVQLYGVGKENN